MKNQPWERPKRIADVRDQLWSYVSPASQREGPGLLVAAALLGWPERDVAELAALQFLLCEEVHDFIQQLPELARRLSTTSVREQEFCTERIRGAVHWGPTIAGRLTNGNPHLHVTMPVERAYQTVENELLVHVLDAIARLAAASGWTNRKLKSEPASAIRAYHDEATKWRSSSMLDSIARVAPTPRSLARIASGRAASRYQCVLDAHRKLDALVERLDRAAIKTAIEETGLVTTQQPILFELLTLFKVIAALKKHGWRLEPLRLFGGVVQTKGTGKNGRQIELWYQSAPPEFGLSSRYRSVLTHHRFQRVHDLRPDLVLKWQTPTDAIRMLVIECKLSESEGVAKAARSALVDLLSYRQAFGEVLEDTGFPYGLGVAWGAELAPKHGQEVMLCTPDYIEDALLITIS